MATILVHSTAPWSYSGYGTQCALWSRKFRDMGHDVLISTYWGLQGAPTTWDGITVLPAFGGSYSSPSLQQHARHIGPDLVLTLGDVWVMDPAVLRELPVALWLPADCRPMSAADRGVVEASGAQLLAMSKFGLARFRDAGFVNSLYSPHGLAMDTWRIPEDKATLRAARWIRLLDEVAGAGVKAPAAPRHEQNYGITSVVFQERRPLDEGKFHAFLSDRLPPGLLRAKGFFWLGGRAADIGFLSVAGGQVKQDFIATPGLAGF